MDLFWVFALLFALFARTGAYAQHNIRQQVGIPIAAGAVGWLVGYTRWLGPATWYNSNNIDTTYRLAFATIRLPRPHRPCTALLVVATDPPDEQRADGHNVVHTRAHFAIAIFAVAIHFANAISDKRKLACPPLASTKTARLALVDAVSALSRSALVDTGVDAPLTVTTSTGFNVPRTADAGTQTCSSQFITPSLTPTSTSAKRRSIDLSRLTPHSALSGASSPVLPLRRRSASADECSLAMRIILVDRLSPANIPVAIAMPAHCPAPSPSSDGEESVVAANTTEPFPEETALEVAGAKAPPPVAVNTSTEQRAVAAAVSFVLVETAPGGEMALESLEPARPIAQDPSAVICKSLASTCTKAFRPNEPKDFGLCRQSSISTPTKIEDSEYDSDSSTVKVRRDLPSIGDFSVHGSIYKMSLRDKLKSGLVRTKASFTSLRRDRATALEQAAGPEVELVSTALTKQALLGPAKEPAHKASFSRSSLRRKQR
ncbi:hypothetical protein GGI20_003051 [Coemansia sp. BCRC 34301]|nr:hypothetical protein GGI20_003051 [Coemansia sp. BCRC 34301]